MVSYRPFILGLAPALGLLLGWPALTSQPAGFSTPVAPATPAPFAIPADAVPTLAPPASAPVPLAASPAAAPPAPATSAVTVPPAPVLLALLRGSLAAVNQANVTGNYSVLRDLGAPAFREDHSVAELADQFRPWRDNALDFAAVLLLDAKLSRPPAIDGNGLLRLAGHFPTAPLRIEFDLGYRAVGGNWRLATISLDARPVEAEPDRLSAQPSRPVAAAAGAPASAPVKVAATRAIPAPALPAQTVPVPVGSPPSAPAPFDMGALLPVGGKAY
ncbi:hypothetical protein LGR54_10885 [Ancylobacter sp. Lp-2]|uniref:hypothetical protein n=1 Tax=Ancylobacter sp. Lp-2 TaxID=2881339 RepID=UPI001E3328C9|nr:hypothetical protein [Ancylobacter sp. Lp-2]MCB4769107.1 hypothetical protein [Ancylobacter sp. Lp-2]